MVTQNAINKTGVTFNGYIPLPGMVLKNSFTSNAGSGDVDLYTAPANTRAYINGSFVNNTAGTSTSIFFEIKVSGVYYKMSATQSRSTGTSTTVSLNIVLEPGESIAINTTQSGMNVWLGITEFPSNLKFYSPKILALTSGDNTLYTAPANTKAFTTQINVFNNCGTTIVLNSYIVPSGNSTSSGNQYRVNTSVLNGALNTLGNTGFGFGAGDFIVLNSDTATAGQLAWLNIQEM